MTHKRTHGKTCHHTTTLPEVGTERLHLDKVEAEEGGRRSLVL